MSAFGILVFQHFTSGFSVSAFQFVSFLHQAFLISDFEISACQFVSFSHQVSACSCRAKARVGGSISACFSTLNLNRLNNGAGNSRRLPCLARLAGVKSPQ
jgi:hypothetical protein